ncbi:hypothetical protein [Methylobacterium platani]|uniref:Uncharacterized protein n=2 Tax=Methylobacterium platani TaxID=427683 RepID=A0A179S3R6_9HYPH|nr:hypothetical protein [Methylobacterium platani]KMO19604.1 hypothetical protein SQ03_07640 [Methylobacterium platani JCM 14648]OAS20095.1 hypothetical protein A5481_23630 [Methylobacterium platani]
MPLYRLRSIVHDPGETASFDDLPIREFPIEAPTVRHAAARILGQADAMFGDRTGEAWLVAEDGARVWSLSLDAHEGDAHEGDVRESEARESAWT